VIGKCSRGMCHTGLAGIAGFGAAVVRGQPVPAWRDTGAAAPLNLEFAGVGTERPPH
jgi:hypothetical protein